VPPFAIARIDEPTWVARFRAPLIVESVEVAALYIFPAASSASPPKERFLSQSVPMVASVDEAFVEDAVSKTDVDEAKRDTGEPVKRSAVEVADTD
jgi:uncharacterized protein YcbX